MAAFLPAGGRGDWYRLDAVIPPVRRFGHDGGTQPLFEGAERLDDEALAVGSVFATHAAVALASAQHDEQMHQALKSRDLIGPAKGILMAQQGVSEDEAFEILRRASQRMNIKLREVAERVASRTPTDEQGGLAGADTHG